MNKDKLEAMTILGKQALWVLLWTLVVLIAGGLLFGWEGLLLTTLILLLIKAQAKHTLIKAVFTTAELHED